MLATTVDVPEVTGVTLHPAGGKKGKTLPKTGEGGLTVSLVGFALMSVASASQVYCNRKSKKLKALLSAVKWSE